MQLTETNIAKQVLGNIPKIRGLMWEKIKEFQTKLETIDGYVGHEAGTPQGEELQKIAPLKQHIEGGLYTRELFMPKGSIIVSMIHKQNHPSFLLKGELSYLTDDGMVKELKAHIKYLQKQEPKEYFMYMKTLFGVVFIKQTHKHLKKQKLMYIQMIIESFQKN